MLEIEHITLSSKTDIIFWERSESKTYDKCLKFTGITLDWNRGGQKNNRTFSEVFRRNKKFTYLNVPLFFGKDEEGVNVKK